MPGDLLMIDPTCPATCHHCRCRYGGRPTHGAYNELLLMWKPVRLQGVGAASSIINANTHPAGKLDPWRREVDCLFGLALNGQPITRAIQCDPRPTTDAIRTAPGERTR